MEEVIIDIQHLYKDFGEVQVLKDIDYQIQKGEVTVIMVLPVQERAHFYGV